MFDIKDLKDFDSVEEYLNQTVYFSSDELKIRYKDEKMTLEKALIYADFATLSWTEDEKYSGPAANSLYKYCLLNKDFGNICDISKEPLYSWENENEYR